MKNEIEFQYKDDPFYRSVSKQVNQELKRRGDHHYANLSLYLKAIFWLLLAVSSYIAMISFSESLVLMYLFGLGFGFSTFYLVINTCHDVVHGSWSKRKWENKIVMKTLINILGTDGRMWALRHAHSHHIFPNVKGCDADIDETEMLRLSPNSKYHWFHQYQHIYAPLVYSILNVHSALYQDFVYLQKKELANLRNLKHSTSDIVTFILNKIAYFSLWILLPWLLTDHSFLTVFFGYVLVTMPLSFAFMPIGITHLNEHAVHVDPENNPVIPTTFAKYQVVSSIDFAPLSPVASFFYGGLNSHAAHHLFPYLSHRHYQWITEIIQKECKIHQVDYREMGFIESWRSHFRYLKALGAPIPAEKNHPFSSESYGILD